MPYNSPVFVTLFVAPTIKGVRWISNPSDYRSSHAAIGWKGCLVVLKKILRQTLDPVLYQPVDDPVGLFLGFGVVA